MPPSVYFKVYYVVLEIRLHWRDGAFIFYD